MLRFVLPENLFPQMKEIGIKRVKPYEGFYTSIHLKTHLNPEVFILFSKKTPELQPTP